MKGEKGESQYRRKKEIGKGKGNPEELVAKLAELGEKVGEYGAESAGKRKAGCGGQVIAVLGNHYRRAFPDRTLAIRRWGYVEKLKARPK